MTWPWLVLTYAVVIPLFVWEHRREMAHRATPRGQVLRWLKQKPKGDAELLRAWEVLNAYEDRSEKVPCERGDFTMAVLEAIKAEDAELEKEVRRLMGLMEG